MKLTPCLKPYFIAVRHSFTYTGQWKKKITKSLLKDVEQCWYEKAVNPLSYNGSLRRHKAGKKYILSMFPYPSGDLHIGHMRVYTICDVLARYHRLNGYQVLSPIGWDSFGLPAENAAIQRNLAPGSWTNSNIQKMKTQLLDLRISFDWDREISTCDPKYYKWTQSLFLQMYEKGLVYYMKAAVNWDPVDQTVLAEEQIDSQGRSWRSGAKVEKKFLTQWYLKATNYSKSLLDGLDSLDPESCRGFANAQREWIKEPSGVRVRLTCKLSKDNVIVYTEEPELLCGVTYIQISPKHFLAHDLDFDKVTGLVKGETLNNPVTFQDIPIVVRDHENFTDKNLSRFGIPCVNSDDSLVARSLGLSCTDVMNPSKRMINSLFMNELTREEARVKCCEYLQEKKIGGYPTSSELNDWLISRQRYWGTPIPVIHCSSCGPVPVPKSDLPVLLPDISSFNGVTGNPLSHQHEWKKVECPQCGDHAVRETDTMDTFVDSSWYFLRYTDHNNEIQPFSRELADQYMPVDVYIGGAEHAILHMYFARFFTHFLSDQKMLSAREPFKAQLALGTVHSDCYKVTDTGKYLTKKQIRNKGDIFVERSTGKPVTHTVEKMSKSKLNGVNPQEVLEMHGVDQTRMYMLANDDPRAIKYWNPDLVKKLEFSHGKQISIPKWLHILWHTVTIVKEQREKLSEKVVEPIVIDEASAESLKSVRNSCIRLVSLHLDVTFRLHDAIYALHDSLLKIDKLPFDVKKFSTEFESCFAEMLVLLHPFAPHMTAELWEGLRSSKRLKSLQNNFKWDCDIFMQDWPELDDDYNVPLRVHLKDKAVNRVDVAEDEAKPERSSGILSLPYGVVKDLSVNQAIQQLTGAGVLTLDEGLQDLEPNNLNHEDSRILFVKNCGADLSLSKKTYRLIKSNNHDQ